jgi:hypothetical protein
MPEPAGRPPSSYEELAEHMASGVVIYVATRDRDLAPESVFAMGAKAECERRVVTVYLPALPALSEATLRNIEDNGQVAITLTRPSDHKSVQVKGRALRVRQGNEADREIQTIHRAALVEQFAGIGVPRATTRRLVWWPSVAVEVEVSEVFAQTPGPGSGERIAGL